MVRLINEGKCLSMFYFFLVQYIGSAVPDYLKVGGKLNSDAEKMWCRGKIRVLYHIFFDGCQSRFRNH